MVVHLITLMQATSGHHLALRTAACGLVLPPMATSDINEVTCKTCRTALCRPAVVNTNYKAPVAAQFGPTARKDVSWMAG